MNASNEVLIHTDPLVQDIVQSQVPPSGWHQRSLYMSAAGCEAWLAAEADAPHTRRPLHLHRLRQALLRTLVSNFISFGPGAGQLDREVLTALRSSTDVVTYIPVDINLDLLQRAIDTIRRLAVIPFGVITDFETDLSFLDRVVRGTNFIVHPVVIGLLGGTFGNLDLLESNFLAQVATITEPGDFLMFDAVVFDSDCGNSATTCDTPAARRFLATGAARQAGCIADEVLANYGRMRVVSGSSDVPGAVVAQIVYDHPDAEPVSVLRFCEYPSESLLDWANTLDEFELFAEELIRPSKGVREFGVVLLRRR